MPPTLANGKICYIEIPASDIARLSLTNVFSDGTSGNATTAAPPLTILPGKSAGRGCSDALHHTNPAFCSM
jgi:hypothetical protein